MKLPMPFDNPSTYPGHVGIDFAQKGGTIIPASGDGIVTNIAFSTTGGWRVWVSYGDRGTIKYVHIDSRDDILVNVGDKVSYGTPIARVGKYGKASGNIPASTGYHLHIENGDKSGADAVWEIVDRNAWVNAPNSALQNKENSAPQNTENEDDEMALRIITCPAYIAADQVAISDGDSFQTVPKGWVVNQILYGRTPLIEYPNNDAFMQEIRTFYYLKGLSDKELEDRIAKIVSGIITPY